MIFWKEAWLKRVDVPATSTQPTATADVCTEEDVYSSACARSIVDAMDTCVYTCQATQLPSASMPLSPWDLRQYIEDYTSGNVDLRTMASGFIYFFYNFFANAKTYIGIGRAFALDV
jgi:hypothetical protein